MQLGYKLKTAICAGITPKSPANCSSVRQLQRQQGSKGLRGLKTYCFELREGEDNIPLALVFYNSYMHRSYNIRLKIS